MCSGAAAMEELREAKQLGSDQEKVYDSVKDYYGKVGPGPSLGWEDDSLPGAATGWDLAAGRGSSALLLLSWARRQHCW